MLVLTDCLWYIACRDGLLAWWGGLLPSLILVFNPAINFMIYEGQKRNILPILSSWVRKMRSCMFCLSGQNLCCICQVCKYREKY